MCRTKTVVQTHTPAVFVVPSTECKQHYFKHYIDNRPQPQADTADTPLQQETDSQSLQIALVSTAVNTLRAGTPY
eukprot:m.452091 g.452091  ORF g.452091 m.452091 type:complete len:75 (-) comp20325_c3_seq47:904-1128(-)